MKKSLYFFLSLLSLATLLIGYTYAVPTYENSKKRDEDRAYLGDETKLDRKALVEERKLRLITYSTKCSGHATGRMGTRSESYFEGGLCAELRLRWSDASDALAKRPPPPVSLPRSQRDELREIRDRINAKIHERKIREDQMFKP